MFKKIFPFFVIYTIVIALYYPVFTTYFSHDDFFHFKVSMVDGGLENFFKLFGFYSLKKVTFTDDEKALYTSITLHTTADTDSSVVLERML